LCFENSLHARDPSLWRVYSGRLFKLHPLQFLSHQWTTFSLLSSPPKITKDTKSALASLLLATIGIVSALFLCATPDFCTSGTWNSRLKKIKCQQPSPEAKCEACKSAKIPCRFRDRERYFAERSRAIAGPGTMSAYGDGQRSSAHAPEVVQHSYLPLSQTHGHPALDAFSTTSSSPASSHSTGRSSSYSPTPNGVVCADVEPNGRYQSYPPDPRRSIGVSHRYLRLVYSSTLKLTHTRRIAGMLAHPDQYTHMIQDPTTITRSAVHHLLLRMELITFFCSIQPIRSALIPR
jgi:hypothetical protein